MKIVTVIITRDVFDMGARQLVACELLSETGNLVIHNAQWKMSKVSLIVECMINELICLGKKQRFFLAFFFLVYVSYAWPGI